MNYEKLTSDKVNYLIWRYLQEAGFGQAAARLQHDWGLQHHPDDLPFAKYIGPRGLITLIQYGLKLHRIQALERPNQPRFFGPDHGTSTSNTTDATSGRTKSTSPSKNIDTSLSTSLSSTKPRSRKPNGTTPAASGKSRGTTGVNESMDMDQPIGATNDAAVATKSENQMDIDDEGSDSKAADETLSSISSPTRNGEHPTTNGLENRSQRPIQEQQSLPTSVSTPTLIHRTSTGTQVDDIIELAPKTTILNTKSIKNTILSHVTLNPPHQTASHSLLAVGGNQLGQIWEIAKGESITSDKDIIDQATQPSSAARELKTIDLAIEPGSSLTSFAWSCDGERLAYSSYSDVTSGHQNSVIKIRLPLADKTDDTYGPVGEAVTNLAWNTTGRYIAGLSSTSVLIFDTKTGNSLRPLDTGCVLFDVAWVDEETLVVCGNSYIALATINGASIDPGRKFIEDAESTEWTKLRYHTSTNSIAVASEASGQIAIIEQTGKTHQETAHASGLSDMIDCPSSNGSGPRILATSSSEGHVKIWQFDSHISLVQRLEMGGVSQALTLSFSPAGNLLAVADWDKILFWDTHGGIQPKFKWELRRVNWPSTHVNGHSANGINGYDHEISMEETFELAPILIWDDSGHSLIFAHKEKIAIINTPT